MSASDLPDSHETPSAMARCLASYIRDPERIRLEVNVAFGSSPCIYTIKEMQAAHARKRKAKDDKPFKVFEGYYPAEASELAALASNVFIKRLREEHPERFAA